MESFHKLEELHFSLKEKFISKKSYDYGINLAEEIGAMLWTEIKALEKSQR